MKTKDLRGFFAIKNNHIVLWLQANGWARDDAGSKPGAYDRYCRNDQWVLVPAEYIGDYTRRKVEMLETLAQAHNKYVQLVVEDMQSNTGLELRAWAIAHNATIIPLHGGALWRVMMGDLDHRGDRIEFYARVDNTYPRHGPPGTQVTLFSDAVCEVAQHLSGVLDTGQVLQLCLEWQVSFFNTCRISKLVDGDLGDTTSMFLDVIRGVYELVVPNGSLSR